MRAPPTARRLARCLTGYARWEMFSRRRRRRRRRKHGARPRRARRPGYHANGIASIYIGCQRLASQVSIYGEGEGYMSVKRALGIGKPLSMAAKQQARAKAKSDRP